MLVQKIDIQEKRMFAEFANLTRDLYANVDAWVQPLTREMRRKLDPNLSAFASYGTVQLLGVYDEQHSLIGRVAAIVNPAHKEMYGEATGFFGLFEIANNPEASILLLSEVERVLGEAGCDRIIGPVNLTTNDETGFLLDGYDRPPTFMCNYCHPYYHGLMEQWGMRKLMDVFSYETKHGHVFPSKYYRVVERVSRGSRVKLDRFDRRRAKDQIKQIRYIYNESFKDTYCFVPISEGEARELADGLLSFADLNLVWIASYDNQPVGFILGFPDINEVFIHMNGRVGLIGLIRLLSARWSVKGVRVAAFGVLPQFRSLGIEAALVYKVHQRINTRPYKRIEFSVVMENNVRMRRILEAFGFELTKKYRLYQKEL